MIFFKNVLTTLFIIFFSVAFGQSSFEMNDIFDIQYANDIQISPDGKQIVYRRMGYDIMSDKNVGNLWILNTDGSNHQKLTLKDDSEFSPRWSPSGDRIAFISQGKDGSEIFMYWIQSSKMARMTQLAQSPSSLSWSNDGMSLAFCMFVPSPAPVIAQIPKSPKGAKWAKKPRITDRLNHESDGRGYIPTGYSHIFVMPSEGGAVRQLSSGNFHHRGNLSWAKDNKSIYFSANRTADWEYDFRNSEIYNVDIYSKTITLLTSQIGPDFSPKVSPNGKKIAFLGFKDNVQAHQNRVLYLMNSNGKNRTTISGNFDNSISNIVWDSSGNGLYCTYDEKGNSKVAYISLNGKVTKLADNLGGTTIGRPYASGSFSVAKNGTIVYTHSRPEHPSELAVIKERESSKLITNLNESLLSRRVLGKTEEVWYTSSFDGRKIQGWIVKPPFYDPSKKYPLLVENHGGPILNYGDRFTAEIQLYAADGYVVFYPNPRGSTSYGEEFANLLYNNYPGQDYNDVMDGVDYLVKKGVVDNNKLFVTGGSAGGIMTAWMIGKNKRFKAAVVVKPVMNWISKTLVADNYFGYANSRYPGQPWENFETYWKFSPLSLVGNISTPTMVMVGMNDLRTPPSEAKQLYHALKLRKIETILVEIPGASHGIAKKPSNLISKVAHVLAWLNKYNLQ